MLGCCLGLSAVSDGCNIQSFLLTLRGNVVLQQKDGNTAPHVIITEITESGGEMRAFYP